MSKKITNKDNANKKKKVKYQSKHRETPVFLWPLIILGLTLIAYIPLFGAGFINWDDNEYVYENSLIQGFSHIGKLIVTPLQGNYHPLTMLSLAFNYSISRYDAWSYHILNILLHLANTYLVYLLALKLSQRNIVIAVTTALLFGIHPMHVESVAWVTERKDMLYSFFFLLGLRSYTKYLENRLKNDYGFTLLWFVLSLLSKPAAVVFPLVMLTIDFLYARKFELKIFTEKIPYFILAFLMGVLTYMAQKNVGATETIISFGLLNRFFFGCYSYMMYIVKMLIPVGLTPFYPFPSVKDGLPLSYYLAPIFMVATFIFCVFTWKKNRVFSFGFAFYLVNIILIMQFFIVGRAIIAERYTYISYFGLFFMLGWGIDKLQSKFAIKWYYIVFAIGFVLTGFTYVQASYWKNSDTLWDHAIEVQPGSRNLQNRATLYRLEGKTDKALEFYSRALTYHDDVIDDAIYTNRGNIYYDKKEFSLAIKDYTSSVNINPKFALGFENRGATYIMLQEFDSAIADLNISINIDSSNLRAYSKRGMAYANSNRHEKAIPDYKKCLEINPKDFEVCNSLGICYRALNNFEEAIIYFSKAINYGKKPEYFLNRSFCYNAIAKKDLAVKDALEARKGGVQISKEYASILGI